jgi:hypothetical protein
MAEVGSGLADSRAVNSRSTVLGAASIDDARQGYRRKSFLSPYTTAALQDLVLHVDDVVQ